ncbi:MAG TPA: protein translocase subunit SecD [Pirellulales bacterium]|nr:protein translocase subunit SecD [Pirellulales bacterium]
MQRMVQMLAVAVLAWGTFSAVAPAAEHSGTFVEAGNGQVTIKEGGQDVTYDVAPDVKVTLEGKEWNLSGLPKDHPVTITTVTETDKSGPAPVKTTHVTEISLPAPWDHTAGGVLMILLGVTIISFFGGNMLARSLRMPNHGWKIAIMLLCVLAGTAVTWLGWPPALGIDLSGGVDLVYAIDHERGKAIATDEKKGPNGEQGNGPNGKAKAIDMGELIAAISRRVNPGGQKEIVVHKYNVDQVEVIIPKADPVEIERIEKIISSSGLLEFRILANTIDHAAIIGLAKQLPLKETEVIRNGDVVARWVKIDMKKFPSANERASMITRMRDGQPECLVIEDAPEVQVNGGDLDYARVGHEGGHYAVDFGFNERGAQKFGQLTGHNLPDMTRNPPFHRQLCIVLDNVLLSAPNLNSRITQNGQITGNFSAKEVQNLVEILNAGKLPAALTQEPVSKQTIDPLLGAVTIREATFAMWLSCIAVPLFMIFYYRFSGIVATLTTALHMLLIVSVMITIRAAFTLTGLAALALTIGMAVDANVLIYERMREELARGAALKMAIRNGFDRALATIIDTNATTLIAATVLYMIGTDQVRGFAVTLWLGVVLNVFTATFGTRVIFDVAERMHLLKKLKMMQIIGVHNFDFMGKQRIWIGISICTTIIGLASFFSLGSRIWDIDFTGGSSVDMIFRADSPETGGVAVVKKKLIEAAKDHPLADLDVYKITIEGQGQDTVFRVITSDQDLEKVKGDVAKAFGDRLKTLNVSLGPVAMVTPAAPEPEKKPENPALPPVPEKKPATPPEPSPTDKGATDKGATEKGATEKGATDKEPAKPDTDKGDKASTDKASTDKGNTDKASSDKASTDKASTDKGNTDKASSEKENAAEQTDKKSSAAERRSNFRLTAAQPSELLLALADDPQPAEPKADDKKADDKVDDKKADNQAKPDDKGVADKQGEEKARVDEKEAADKKATDEKAKPEPGTAAVAPPKKTPPKELVKSDAGYIGGTKFTATFSGEISYAIVDSMLTTVENKMKKDFPDLHHILSNPKYEGNPRVEFKQWDIQFSVPPDRSEPIVQEFRTLAESPIFANAAQLGPQVASKTELQTVYALVASWALIILYVWIRFQRVAYGLAAVIALIHDVIVAIGALALCHYFAEYLPSASQALLLEPFKINLTIIAAVLTIIGYSVNDTIVVFDRIREVKGKAPDVTDRIVNESINQTLSRTLLTSFTVFLVVLILYVFGGTGVRAFAFTMLIGVLTGTYSSIYIASPILVWMERLGKSHREKLKLASTSHVPTH